MSKVIMSKENIFFERMKCFKGKLVTQQSIWFLLLVVVRVTLTAVIYQSGNALITALIICFVPLLQKHFDFILCCHDFHFNY